MCFSLTENQNQNKRESRIRNHTAKYEFKRNYSINLSETKQQQQKSDRYEIKRSRATIEN